MSKNETSNRTKDAADQAKHRSEGSTRQCSCACEVNCNCRCVCRDHCVCKRPCDGQCGSRVSRNLVVCIDGSSNQFGVHNTNVVELHSRVVVDALDDQCKYYNCGIGTYVPSKTKTSWKYWRQRIDNTIDLAFAWNFKDIILKAYRWLSQTYTPGDKIFLFGFSRGAYQVRTLAAMIQRVGLVHSGNEEIISFAYEIYEERHKGEISTEAKEIAQNFKNTFSRDVRIHFAGLWDTVSSVGLVRGKPLPLTWSAEHICIFRHALALDERRVKFLPEYVGGGGSTRSSKKGGFPSDSTSPISRIGPDIKEVWFAGTHSDIGGGIKKNLELNLSSVPLLWMENEATSAGLRLKPRASGGAWKMSELGQDDVHESLRGFWRLVEHFPVKRLSFKNSTELTRTPHRGAGRVIVPGQRVHVSVAFKRRQYVPKATFLEDGHLEWRHFVGKRMGSDFEWAYGFVEVEMDLFDASFMVEAIHKLEELRASGATSANEFKNDDSQSDSSQSHSYWIKRLAFMALSGQLAGNYLSKLQLKSPQNRLGEVRVMLGLFRWLQDVQPAIFDADVAVLLEDEAHLLLALDQKEEALMTYREAVTLRRTVAVPAIMASWRDNDNLASCLQAISRCCDMLGQFEEAVAPVEEAVQLRRDMAKSSRDYSEAVRNDAALARSLSRFGIALAAVNRFNDAVHTEEQAVNLRRKLLEEDLMVEWRARGNDLPESTHRRQLISGICDWEKGNRNVDRERDGLASVRPEKRAQDLAQSLYNLGFVFRAMDRAHDALRVDEEAVALRRTLVDNDATATKYLAQSLHFLGLDLSTVNRHEDALRVDQEAVELRRTLAETDPTAIQDLGCSLHALAFDLRALDRSADALRVEQEAVQLRRRLSETNPTVAQGLARSLYCLGADLRALGRHEDALRADGEAVEIRRKLAEADPRLLVSLANSLENLGLDLNAVGRHEDAVGAAEEAVELYHKLPDSTMDSQFSCANTLMHLASYLDSADRHEEAMVVHEKVAETLRKLAEMYPRSTARSFHVLAQDFRSTFRRQDALHAEEKAIELYRKVMQTEPAVTDFIQVLESLAKDQRALGFATDATRTDTEIATLRDMHELLLESRRVFKVPREISNRELPHSQAIYRDHINQSPSTS